MQFLSNIVSENETITKDISRTICLILANIVIINPVFINFLNDSILFFKLLYYHKDNELLVRFQASQCINALIQFSSSLININKDLYNELVLCPLLDSILEIIFEESNGDIICLNMDSFLGLVELDHQGVFPLSVCEYLKSKNNDYISKFEDLIYNKNVKISQLSEKILNLLIPLI